MVSLRDFFKSSGIKNFGMPRKTAAFIVALAAYPLAHLLDGVTYRAIDQIVYHDELRFIRHFGLDKIGRAILFMLLIILVFKLACRWTPTLGRVLLGVFGVSVFVSVALVFIKKCIPEYALSSIGFFVNYGCRCFVSISGIMSVLAILIIQSMRRKRVKKYSKVSRVAGLILCKSCGADMSACNDLCCVNCKTSYTLDELLAVNSRRKQAEKPKGGNDEA